MRIWVSTPNEFKYVCFYWYFFFCLSYKSPLLLFFLCIKTAWLTVWPADVIKTQRQSGNYATKSTFQLLEDNIKTGRLYRGVLPGLVRSTIANGSSMVVYEYVATTLTKKFDLERTDLA